MEKKRNTAVKALILIWLLKLIAILPRFITRLLAFFWGALSYLVPSKAKSIARANLQICFPQQTPTERKKLLKSTFKENARLVLEFATAWFGKKENILRLITETRNQALIDQSTGAGKPLIIAVPHIGNWEFFSIWLQLNYPTVGMYRPAKIPQIDQHMKFARERFGGQAFATDARGLRGLLKSLKQGNAMIILPDQVPKSDASTSTPFFGKSAATMTLLHKLIKTAKADLLFASCLRNSSGDFTVELYSPEFDIKADVEVFNAGMNRQLESIIMRAPAQYQWGYKRFKRQVDGSNPYL